MENLTESVKFTEKRKAFLIDKISKDLKSLDLKKLEEIDFLIENGKGTYKYPQPEIIKNT